MRLALLSDIHFDLAPANRQAPLAAAIAAELSEAGTDVVLVAGDVANRQDKVGRHLARIAVGRLANLYVPGNHDIWRSEAERRAGHESFAALTLLRGQCAQAGFHYLPGAPQRLGQGENAWGFVGSLGWYDYSFAAEWLHLSDADIARKEIKGIIWQDREAAHFNDRTGRRLSDREVLAVFLGQLETDLRALGLDERGAGPPTVALTHTLPYRSLVEYRQAIDWDYFSSYLGSARLGQLYDRYPQVRAAFAGHTHIPHQERLADGRIRATAPIGYYGTREFPYDLGTRIAFFDTVGRNLVPVGR